MMQTSRKRPKPLRAYYLTAGLLLLALGLVLPAAAEALEITANVVVLDNPTVFNRLGAQNPNWITYALKRDVVNKATQVPCNLQGANCTAGNVMLRPDKRPRPLVVRSVAGADLTVHFTNWLTGPGQGVGDEDGANPNNFIDDNPPPFEQTDAVLINNNQVKGRCAGFHASGTELRGDMVNVTGVAIGSDGSMVGKNHTGDDVAGNCGFNDQKGGLVGPNGTITYYLHTPKEGAFIINSYGATLGSDANSGNLAVGMFGALNVEPVGSRIYRSQVTEEELRLATDSTNPGNCTGTSEEGNWYGIDCDPGGQPIINYEATYPTGDINGSGIIDNTETATVWDLEGKGGLPVLNMIHTYQVSNGNGGMVTVNELVHSDINAIIAGPNGDGSFPPSTYPLESVGKNVPSYPNRLEPYREFTSIYHDEQANTQVFPNWYLNPVLSYTLAGVKDAFMINYGSGGIGSEIIANRLRTGPMHDCTDCAYEEFFLASQTVGDPGLLVNYPANTGIEQCDPTAIADPSCWRDPVNLANGPIPGNYALFQEDPSNVHHTYLGDFVKVRNIHAGAFEQHIFHQHNHQWLFNPNDDNGNYLDAQEIMPGSGHTYEYVNGGAGNRNKSVGDAIFHCHFYPHFAQGMWYHIRIQETFERGSVLAVSGVIDPQNPPLDTGFHTAAFELRSGRPAAGARALPDGELPDGVPIPAIVPLPGKPMPQMPAEVSVMAVDRGDFSLATGRQPPAGQAGNTLNQGPDSSQAVVNRTSVAGADGELGTPDDVSPGYPFWLAGNECGPNANPDTGFCPQGTVGQRMPTPPLDMLTDVAAAANAGNPYPNRVNWTNLGGGWDGGLPRHNLLGYTAGGLSLDTQNRLDFRKVVERAQPVYFPETGTDLEQVSMAYQAVRNRPSAKQDLSVAGGAVIPDSESTSVKFVLNGAPPVPSGPYNDPCIDDTGAKLDSLANEAGYWFDGDGTNDPAVSTTLTTRGVSEFDSENPRTYKVANVQIDAVFNKVGYHYPQERIIALWEDVADTIAKLRPPQPLVMRMNTFDCGKILHANLVPAEFELDDFQVRTPTDIIGQHIHLPKWDLTSNDGAANGWNYEDGTLSPIMVQERIHAIDVFNAEVAAEIASAGTHPDLAGLAPVATLPNPCSSIDYNCGTPGGLFDLTAQPHPFFGEGQLIQTSAGPEYEYKGARTTIQRFLVDPVVNVAGVDRGLGMTFSHDHYGPSTFQQVGLYSTIIAEPAGSTWKHNESGVALYNGGGRTDGGPVSWQAVILPPDTAPIGSTVQSENIPDHREFYFEMSDFQHAYEAGVYVGADANGRPTLTNINQPIAFNATVAAAPALANTWQQAVNPPLKLKSVPFPDVVTAPNGCLGGQPRPCPEAINIAHGSTWVINYRNEPVGLRVFNPDGTGPDGNNGTQAGGKAGDLAFAFQSRTDRAIPQLNTSFGDMPPGYSAGADYCQGANGDLINCDRNPGDPITPIMRAYARDEIKVKIQTGATEEQHQASVHGLKWLSNGSGFGRSPNSGWRNFQSDGISEQFSLQIPLTPDQQQAGATVDYLYGTDLTRDGVWSGTWGILRSYGQRRQDLYELPDNPQRGGVQIVNAGNFDGVCPRFELDEFGNPVDPPGRGRNIPVVPVQYDVTAVLANDVLPNNFPGGDGTPGTSDDVLKIKPNTQITIGGVVVGGDSDGDGIGDNVGGPLNTAGGTLVYNRRGTGVTVCDGNFLEDGTCDGTPRNVAGPLNDPTAIMYVRTEDMVDPNNPKAGLKPGVPVEPLVLRANAGDCIDVTLRNRLLDQAYLTADPATLVVDADGAPVFEDQGELLFADVNGDGVIDPETENVLPEGVTFDLMPDLAGWQDMMWVVKREVRAANGGPLQMHFFNNNLIRPSAHVGLHAQLVDYDASRDDGLLVGQNQQGLALAAPGGQKTFRWYAGDLRHEPVAGGGRNVRRFRIIPTPVEFGGVNLLSADRVKQPQKGLFGALVIEPPDTVDQQTTWVEDTQVPDGQANEATTPQATRLTRAQATVTAPEGGAGSGGTYREALLIGHKITNLRWADGTAVININQGELGREGAEDSGHAGFNYGMEPSWFRFGLAPDAPFGNAGAANSYGSIPNVHALYANDLVSDTTVHPNTIPQIAGVSELGDPVTPVFRTTVDPTNPVFDTRMHVLNGASADRDGTFILHGHLWQRDPFVCPDQNDGLGTLMDGRCNQGNLVVEGNPIVEPVPSRALGLNPQGKWMGGEEGLGHVYSYWPILFDAGGTDGVAGDYLYRDYAPNGNRNGQFGILRVQP